MTHTVRANLLVILPNLLNTTLLLSSLTLFTLGCGNSPPNSNASLSPVPASSTKALEENSHRRNIERVLAADRKANESATSVSTVVAAMRKIDTSGCPNDFRAAFLAHIHAWENLGEVETAALRFKSTSESGEVMAESFIRGLLGDPFGKTNEIMQAQNQLQAAAQNASQEVKSTYRRVEEVAILHGANTQR
jgi:hypothetical protein